MVQVWVNWQLLRHPSPFVARCPHAGIKESMLSLGITNRWDIPFPRTGYSLRLRGKDWHRNLQGARILNSPAVDIVTMQALHHHFRRIPIMLTKKPERIV